MSNYGTFEHEDYIDDTTTQFITTLRPPQSRYDGITDSSPSMARFGKPRKNREFELLNIFCRKKKCYLGRGGYKFYASLKEDVVA